jgi:hypothetical protein
MYLAKIAFMWFPLQPRTLEKGYARTFRFIERRIDQLIDEAIELPDGSPEQQRIDRLIGALQDRLVARLEGTPWSCGPTAFCHSNTKLTSNLN